MKKQRFALLSFVLGFVFVIFFAPNGFAKLGGKEDSLVADQKELNFEKTVVDSTPQALNAKSVKVHILVKKHGTLKEYLNEDGVVFAVVWSGSSHPNLSKLLGDYYTDYHNEFRKKHRKNRGREPELTKTSKIVLHRSGHMRNVYGKAYCPSLVPSNFDLGSL